MKFIGVLLLIAQLLMPVLLPGQEKEKNPVKAPYRVSKKPRPEDVALGYPLEGDENTFTLKEGKSLLFPL